MNFYDLLLAKKLNGGGGSSVTIEALSVTSNGTYTASEGYAFSPVSVNVSGIVPSGTLSITANGTYDVTAFASASVLVGGGGTNADAIMDRTYSGSYVAGSTVTSVPNGFFQSCHYMAGATFPNATTIGNNAFASCFYSTPNSVNIVLSFPECTTIGSSAFNGGQKIKGISFPKATSINQYAFNRCASLVSADLPLCVSIGANVFSSCYNLTDISVPNLQSIGVSAFFSCTKLATISLPSLKSLMGFAFDYCIKLESVYITSPSVPTGSTSSMFRSTPIANSSYLGYFGSIYVPASLVDSYKTATGWSMYSDRITAIS